MSECKKEILLGNCLELMNDIPNRSINMILTDPPYQLDNHGGGKTEFAQRKLVKDLHIDFISNSFDMTSVFDEFERICFPMNLIIFCSNKQISKIMKHWEDKKYSVSLMIWDKPNPVPFGNGKYISNLEFIIYVRGKNAIFNNLGYKEQLKTFKYSSPIAKQRLHPTEKPIEMLERLINIHSNINDTVLDCFAGSGSTAMACLNTNRQFIVMEKEQKYYDIILKRVGDFNKNFEPQTLFGNEM